MYNKTDKKGSSFSPRKPLRKDVRLVFHYGTTSQVQKKFQDGNSVLKKQKL